MDRSGPIVGACSVIVVALMACVLGPAGGAEASGRANPAERLAHLPLDAYAYDYAAGCRHATQPGTLAFEAWLRRTRPRGTSWGMESCRAIPVAQSRLEVWRACVKARRRLEGRLRRRAAKCPPKPRPSWSLHAEGRALDWHLDAADPRDRREADRLIRLLLAPDSSGAPHALARRMGVQEIIWNCRAWFSGARKIGPYGVCRNPDGSRRPGVDPTLAHRDHVHFGLNWAGARLRTTFWTARASSR